VGERVVHAFYGAMQFERVGEGAIITTGTFTQEARDWAKDKSIHLYGGEEFLKVLRRAHGVEKQTASSEPFVS
jgi:restriction endonuclease Mrr